MNRRPSIQFLPVSGFGFSWPVRADYYGYCWGAHVGWWLVFWGRAP